MRTTVDLNDDLLRRAKKRAADEGVPLREVIEAALRGHLEGAGRRRESYRLRWRTEKGKLRPGVRLDDRGALFDLMGERK
jgi:hypothetical protein